MAEDEGQSFPLLAMFIVELSLSPGSCFCFLQLCLQAGRVAASPEDTPLSKTEGTGDQVLAEGDKAKAL